MWKWLFLPQFHLCKGSMVFVALMVNWIKLCLHSLPVMNHRQNKNTSFKNLDLSLTRTYEAPFNITDGYCSTWDTCLIFFSLKPCCSRSLYHQRLILCQMETSRASAICSVHLHFSAYTASHISYTFSLWMPGRLLFKQGTFLLPPQKKKKSFHKSGRRRKKIKLKQHNYISFSSILSTRWECEPQRKPPLLLGVT